MTFWVINLLNGFSFAMVLFLLAAGLTLIFGLLRVINLAHGSFYLLGGYVGLAVMHATGSFVAALLVAFAAMAALGAVLQHVCLARLYKQDLPQALLTLGVLFIIADVAFLWWGGNPQLLPQPEMLQGGTRLFGISYPIYRLFLIVMGVGAAALMWLFIERTRLGAVVRAGMDDEEMLRGIGINAPLVFTGILALGAGLAGAAGVLGAPMLGLYPGEDFEVLLLAFVVVTVGGLGSIPGAFLASILIGLIDNFGNIWFPQFSLFTIIAPMVVVLALRPTGLMGRA